MKTAAQHETYDVAVVGGGPGGATAARCLAKEGFGVVLFEKERLPRTKVCAGGIIPMVVDTLPEQVKQTIHRNCYKAELYLVDESLHFAVRRKEPIVVTAMRDRFDFELVKAAEGEGVRVVTGCKVLDVTQDRHMVGIRTDDGVFRSRFVVGADGAVSMVARKAGFEGHGCLVPALETEVGVDPPLFCKFESSVRFDFGIVPKGYGWVFPKKTHLSIGVGRMRRGRAHLEKILDEYFQYLGIPKPPGLRRRGFVVPIMPRRDVFVKRHALLVGDAAGLVDPVTGEGISAAIVSGRLAAHALVKGGLNPDRVKTIYESELRKRILVHLKWGRAVSRLAYDHPRTRSLLFRFCGQQLCEAMTDIIFGRKVYRSVFLNPLTYLGFLMPHRK